MATHMVDSRMDTHMEDTPIHSPMDTPTVEGHLMDILMVEVLMVEVPMEIVVGLVMVTMLEYPMAIPITIPTWKVCAAQCNVWTFVYCLAQSKCRMFSFEF